MTTESNTITAIVRIQPEQDSLVKAFYDQALGLIEERILDCQLTAGNPAFSDKHRMAARARIDELEWMKGLIKEGKR